MHQLFFYLLLVLLPTQLGVHFWPGWALVLGRRIDYLSPTLYVTDVIIFLMLISWGASQYNKFSIFPSASLRAGIFQFLFKKRKFKYLIFKLILLTGFVGLNIFFAANRMVAFFAWIKILELVALGVYIVHTKPKFSSLVIPLSIGVFYSSVIAIIQFFLQHSVGGLFWFLGERTFSAITPGIAQIPLCFPNRFNCPLMLRAYATFPHPNVLGGFLAVTIPLLIFNFKFSIFNQTKKFLIFDMATIILGIIALILTFSRSAWVVAVLSSMYVLFKKRKHVFFPVICFSIIFIFFIGNTFGFQDEAVVVRQQLNAAAISMVRTSPILGNGLGNFLIQLPDYLVSRQIYFLQPVHNIYLLILSETGVVGFAIFLWVIWKTVKNISRKFFIFHFAFFILLLLGLVDHYPLTLQQGQLMFTIFLSLSLIQ
jgi:O-antigen ligase